MREQEIVSEIVRLTKLKNTTEDQISKLKEELLVHGPNTYYAQNGKDRVVFSKPTKKVVDLQKLTLVLGDDKVTQIYVDKMSRVELSVSDVKPYVRNVDDVTTEVECTPTMRVYT